MDEIADALRSFLSNDDTIRRNAERYLSSCITTNSQFYQNLFDLFSDLTHTQKLLALILIKTQLMRNTPVILENLSIFSNLLQLNISKTQDTQLLAHFSDIIVKTTMNVEEIWDDYFIFLTTYQHDQTLFPLSFYICAYSLSIHDVLAKYQDILKEVTLDIISQALQYSDFNIQIHASNILIQLINSSIRNNSSVNYQPLIDILYSNAENSINNNDLYFDRFWSSIYNLPVDMAEPFYSLARTYLDERDNNPHTKSVLFQFIINNIDYLDPTEYEDMIKSYFILQLEVEDHDYSGSIFKEFYNINADLTYPYFKENLCELLQDSDHECQEVALFFLPSFAFYFLNEITPDISMLIDLAFSVEQMTQEDVFYVISFLAVLQLNPSDCNKVCDFILEVITNFSQNTIQHKAFQLLAQLDEYSFSFDTLVDILPQIQYESMPMYLNCLITVYNYNSNLSFKKYEPLIDSIIQLFNQASQHTSELSQELTSNTNEFDKQTELYSELLLLSSSATAIIFFSIFLPLKLEEYIQPAFDAIIESFEFKTNDDELGPNHFTLIYIENTFSYIFKFSKKIYIDYFRSYYNEFFADTPRCSNLKMQLLQVDGLECPFAEGIIQGFITIHQQFIEEENHNLKWLIETLYKHIFPISKWLFKIPRKELHFSYLEFLEESLDFLGKNVPKVTSDIFISFHKLISKMHINYYKENNVEWYQEFFDKINDIASNAAQEILPNINNKVVYLWFDVFVEMISLFFSLHNDIAHDIFENNLVPFYTETKVNFENKTLMIFSDILDTDFYTESEIETIAEIIDNIMNSEPSYQDNRLFLYDIITKLSKLNLEFASQYFQLAIDQFNEELQDENELQAKISMALYLLTMLNHDSDQFGEVFDLLPNILSLFPVCEIGIFPHYFDEINKLINDKFDLLSKELVEDVIAAFTRLLSYQTYAKEIFGLSNEQFNDLVSKLAELINSYCESVHDTTAHDIISGILSEQPTSIDYVLSLLTD